MELSSLLYAFTISHGMLDLTTLDNMVNINKILFTELIGSKDKMMYTMIQQIYD